nr:unknown function [Klebsiella phage vB_Ko_K41P2]
MINQAPKGAFREVYMITEVIEMVLYALTFVLLFLSAEWTSRGNVVMARICAVAVFWILGLLLVSIVRGW